MSVQIHETPAPTEADARQARETLGRKRGRDGNGGTETGTRLVLAHKTVRVPVSLPQNRPRPGFAPRVPVSLPPDVTASRDHPSDFDSGPDQKRVDNPPERFNAARRVAARGVVLTPSSPCPGARQGPRSLGAVGYPAICA
jgi:hypothetical protein